MFQHQMFGTAVLIGVVVASAGCEVDLDAQAYTSRDVKRFDVTGTPDLTLATFDGAIDVHSWDRTDVEVVIERKAHTREQAEALDIKADQSGNRISVEVQRPRGADSFFHVGLNTSASARLSVSVPHDLNLVARSGDGSLTVERVAGRLELRTGDGSIRGSDLKGQLRVHTGDGGVTLEGIEGDVDLDSGDGGIAVAGKLSSVRARTGDGGVSIRASTGSTMASDWDISTGDGSVVLDLPDGFDAELDAHTGDGSVQVSELRIEMAGSASRDSVRGKLGSGGRSLRVRSGDGSIRLRKW